MGSIVESKVHSTHLPPAYALFSASTQERHSDTAPPSALHVRGAQESAVENYRRHLTRLFADHERGLRACSIIRLPCARMVHRAFRLVDHRPSQCYKTCATRAANVNFRRDFSHHTSMEAVGYDGAKQLPRVGQILSHDCDAIGKDAGSLVCTRRFHCHT